MKCLEFRPQPSISVRLIASLMWKINEGEGMPPQVTLKNLDQL